MSRELTYAAALCEALEDCLERDPSVYVMGLGAPDPKGVFGTTSGLLERFGPDRVQDMPCSENAMTGVAIGSALGGLRPVMTHQRVDFALLALEQLVNQAANWEFMFGGAEHVPLTVRLIIGRGWGQGPQHSQSLQAWFAHVPGLKVVMPATPHDAKGLLTAAIEDNGPVVVLEHRWLYGLKGDVPEGHCRVPLGQARTARSGSDVTLVGLGFMTIECLRAADMLADIGVEAEVIDLRSLKPWDAPRVLESVDRTGRLVVADQAWHTAGFAAEVVATVVEQAFDQLSAPPRRVTLPDSPTPTSPALSRDYYPLAIDIARTAAQLCERDPDRLRDRRPTDLPFDVPDPTFTGPF